MGSFPLGEARMSEDTEDRAIVFIYNKEGKVLVGHAVNKPHNKPNTWDLMKGHIEVGEKPLTAALRECREECGLVLKPSDLKLVKQVPYQKGLAYVYEVHLDYNPTKEEIVCKSTFVTPFGKVFPELSYFAWVDYSELKNYLYNSLVQAFGL